MATPSKLRSLELEKTLLAGMIEYPKVYFRVSLFISERDFSTRLHKFIFKCISMLLESRASISNIIIADKVQSLNATFEDDISVIDYLDAITLVNSKEEHLIETARRIAIKTYLRSIWQKGQEISKYATETSDDIFDDIVRSSDALYHKDDKYFNTNFTEAENIFEGMEDTIEEYGNNAGQEMGLKGPHEIMHNVFGSICRPSNITIFAARSGTGKTFWMMGYGMQLSNMHDIPILHLDNGEMSKEELQIRATATLSGVPSYFIESGQFRKNQAMFKKIKQIYPLVKKLKYFYYNVAGMSTEQILNYVRKFYFTNVGRGVINKTVIIFDYLKLGIERSNDESWIKMGELLIKIKNFIRTEVPVGIIAGLQTNRYDISTSKHSKDLTENESVLSLSDLIGQNASHVFHFRPKTSDELLNEDQKFGTYKLLCYKARHLGKDRHLFLEPTSFPDNTLRKFWINFKVENFNVKEEGSSIDVANYLEDKLEVEDDGKSDKDGQIHL
jgi:replicative DNA helicase